VGNFFIHYFSPLANPLGVRVLVCTSRQSACHAAQTGWIPLWCLSSWVREQCGAIAMVWVLPYQPAGTEVFFDSLVILGRLVTGTRCDT